MDRFKTPEHYWKIAEEYIKRKSLELKQSKYYLDEDLAIKMISTPTKKAIPNIRGF